MALNDTAQIEVLEQQKETVMNLTQSSIDIPPGVSAKEQDRQEIRQHIDTFLANGGEIKQLSVNARQDEIDRIKNCKHQTQGAKKQQLAKLDKQIQRLNSPVS
jgi:hypothetical protein